MFSENSSEDVAEALEIPAQKNYWCNFCHVLTDQISYTVGVPGPDTGIQYSVKSYYPVVFGTLLSSLGIYRIVSAFVQAEK